MENNLKRQLHSRWIGCDEAGKGDYFGPLVIASVSVDDTIVKSLEKLGIRDSKRLSDNSVSKLAAEISKLCRCSVVTIGPQKYNELYGKIGNLNRLLAWGHSRAIENILNVEECDYALSDRFGDEKFIIEALMEKGRKIRVEQKTKAEEDMGVAAASILARAEFVHRLAMLSTKYRMDFPKGASHMVIEAGREFIKRYGRERLREVAKIHFRTTKLVLAQ
jgi:ribonuclease HIII